MTALMDYTYPGNVRELQNLIERVVVLKRKGMIDLEDLPDKIYLAEQQEQGHFEIEKGYDTLVSNFEKSLILQALQETNGVKSKAAQVLA